ncbi:MAG: hypothetical protein B7X41_02345, partial [Microbacterium sp. 14-71-5]
MLLIAALSVADRVDVLVSATEIDARVLTSPAVTARIRFRAGRYSFLNEYARTAAIGSASPATVRDAHRALARAHGRLGLATAAWHALHAESGTSRRASRSAVVLGERLLAAGKTEAAVRIAQALSEDMDLEARSRSMLLGGRAALSLGCLDDAEEFFDTASRDPNEAIRTQAVVGKRAVVSYLEGPPDHPDAFVRQDAQRPALAAAANAIADRPVKTLIDAAAETWWTIPTDVDPVLGALALSLSPCLRPAPWTEASTGISPLVEAYARVVQVNFLLYAKSAAEAAPVMQDALCRLPLTHILGGAAYRGIASMLDRAPELGLFLAPFEAIGPRHPVRQDIDRSLPGETTAAASRNVPTAPRIRLPSVPLTAQEQNVLQLVSQGLRNREVGQQLKISDRTVEVHLSHVFRKTNVTSRAELLALLLADRSPKNVGASRDRNEHRGAAPRAAD